MTPHLYYSIHCPPLTNRSCLCVFSHLHSPARSATVNEDDNVDVKEGYTSAKVSFESTLRLNLTVDTKHRLKGYISLLGESDEIE
jgi:hypothetical protein